MSNGYDAHDALLFAQFVDDPVGTPACREATLVLEHQPLAEPVGILGDRLQRLEDGPGD